MPNINAKNRTSVCAAITEREKHEGRIEATSQFLATVALEINASLAMMRAYPHRLRENALRLSHRTARAALLFPERRRMASGKGLALA